jgi:hypothetical protein
MLSCHLGRTNLEMDNNALSPVQLLCQRKVYYAINNKKQLSLVGSGWGNTVAMQNGLRDSVNSHHQLDKQFLQRDLANISCCKILFFGGSN